MKGRKASKASASSPLVAHDLSPMDALGAADEAWLRELVRQADTDTLSLSFTSAREVEQAPLAYFDWQSGMWWAGRFVGELTYQGRTLTILPRFGMPALRRWLSRIWGVRLLSSTGSYTGGRVWLWELIARLWSDRLVAAAKHGLPRVRFDEVHVGPTVRGRLLVPQTAATLHTGQQTLASRTRSRRIDPRIGGILLGAYDHLRRQLSHVAEPRVWLSERGQELVRELQSSLARRTVEEACLARSPIRYTPISESYRPAVDLSLAVLGGRPFMSSADGNRQVYGVLLDMAEIWELYVFSLLRDQLPEAEVVHSGRSADAVFWLLHGKNPGDSLGAMKPDIVISSQQSSRRLIVDAKYKLTTPGPSRPQGIHREDLYQMAAYLSVCLEPHSVLDGALVYPASDTTESLQRRGPFRVNRTNSALAFFGLDCQGSEDVGDLTPAELRLARDVRRLLLGADGLGSGSASVEECPP